MVGWFQLLNFLILKYLLCSRTPVTVPIVMIEQKLNPKYGCLDLNNDIIFSYAGDYDVRGDAFFSTEEELSMSDYEFQKFTIYPLSFTKTTMRSI